MFSAYIHRALATPISICLYTELQCSVTPPDAITMRFEKHSFKACLGISSSSLKKPPKQLLMNKWIIKAKGGFPFVTHYFFFIVPANSEDYYLSLCWSPFIICSFVSLHFSDPTNLLLCFPFTASSPEPGLIIALFLASNLFLPLNMLNEHF